MRKDFNLVLFRETIKYVITFFIIALAILIKVYFLKPLGIQTLNLLMIGAILVVSRYLGIKYSVFALILSSLGLHYFVYSPHFGFDLSITSLLQTFTFIAEASAVIYVMFQFMKSKQANESSGKRFEKLIENSKDGIVLMDINSKVLYASAGIERILGYSAEEFRDINPAELMDIEELPIIQKLFDGFNDSYGTTRTAIHKFKHKDGHWIWIESTLTNLLQDPDVKAILSNFRDVSSNINLENEQNRVIALQEKIISEAENARLKFEFIADNMQHKVWMHAADGEITYINKAWLDYSAITSIEEWTPEMVVPTEDQEELYRNWNEALQKGEEFTLEQKYRRYDNAERWHAVKAFPLKNQAEDIFSWVGVNTDIHDLKTQNQELEASQALLAKKDEFISIASHELKTPLTSIKASLQLLEKMIGKEKISPMVISLTSKANKSVNRLSDLVSDLLNTTKIEKGQLLLQKKNFLLNGLVEECCENIRSEGKYNIITKGDSALKVYADPHKIEQVIANLINNAIKYSPGSNQIIISYQKVEDMVKISIQDFGVGIPEETIPYLFDRYYRVDEDGVQFSGLGLGLYISSQIVQKHNGEMGVESIKGKGSTFWFTLHSEKKEEEYKMSFIR